MILGAYRIALDATRAAAEAAVRRLVLSLYDRTERDASIRVLTPALTEVVRSHRKDAYGHAVEMIRTQAEEQGAEAPYLPSQSGYSEQSVRTILDEDLRGSPDEAVQIIAPKLGQHVEDSARQTVIRTVEDGRAPKNDAERKRRSRDALSPEEMQSLAREEMRRQARGIGSARWSVEGQQSLSWGRVLSGAENCGFCVMLASRGPVYRSAGYAGRKKASQLYDTKSDVWMNDYHPNCDCLVVPIYSFEKWGGWDDVRKLEKFYEDAVENADWDRISADNPNLAAVEQALRRLEKDGKTLPIPDLRSTAGAARKAA